MDVEGCPVPEDLLYDLENDVWWRPAPDGTGTVGLTAPMAAFAGRFQSIQFRPVTGVVERGRSVATVESVRYTGAIRLPVDAEVVERNPSVVERPRLVNDAPYSQGWLVRIRPRDPRELGERLRPASEARAVLAAQIRERHIRCYAATPDVELYEIGIECSAVLAQLDAELARRSPGDVVLLVTDDPTSPIEMVRWSDRSGHTVLDHRREGPLEHFLVRREAEPHPRRPGASR